MTDPTPPKVQEPDWVLVPREPTEAMLEAGGRSMADIIGDPYAHDHWMHFANEVFRVYRPMLAAVPATLPGTQDARAAATLESLWSDFGAWFEEEYPNVTDSGVRTDIWRGYYKGRCDQVYAQARLTPEGSAAKEKTE